MNHNEHTQQPTPSSHHTGTYDFNVEDDDVQVLSEIQSTLDKEVDGAQDLSADASIFHVREYFRFMLVMGGGAMAVMFLGGIFNSVSFSTIVWRMFISGVIFSVLGLISGLLVRTFVPELWSVMKRREVHTRNREVGEKVDFVADDALRELFEHASEQDPQFDNSVADIDYEVHKKDPPIHKKYNIPNDPELLARGIRTVLHKK